MNKIQIKKQRLVEKMKELEAKQKREQALMKEQAKAIENEIDSEIVKIVRNGISKNIQSFELHNELKAVLA